MQRLHGTIKYLSLNVAFHFLDFDHGLVKIVRLIVKKYLGLTLSHNIFIIILAAVSKRHRPSVLLVPPHVYEFLVYVTERHLRGDWIFRFSF